MMRTLNTHSRRLLPALAITVAIGLALTGCKTTPVATTASSVPAQAGSSGKTTPDGATIWAENCGRCHNLRSPSEFSYDQWQVIVHHMRIRATLTAKETRAILKFLKAAH